MKLSKWAFTLLIVSWILLVFTLSPPALSKNISNAEREAGGVRSNKLGLMLLPPARGTANPQIAISWTGPDGGRLVLSAVDQVGVERNLTNLTIDTGMQLATVVISDTDRSIIGRVKDEAGISLDSASCDVPKQPAVYFPSIQKGSGAEWKATFVENGGPDRAVFDTQIWNDGTGDALYIGGDFGTAGGVIANNIAKWNGVSWSNLGSGVNGAVWALDVYNGKLIVGGSFLMAGQVSAPRLAQWNGSTWSSVGSGMGARVADLTVYNGNLIAAGEFTNPANRIASWNGQNWTSLGLGADNTVHSLGIFGNTLVAGGDFSTAAGTSAADNIAKWNGITWTPLGAGVDTLVYAMTVYNGELVTGGFASTAGGMPASGVARWNGSNWAALGSGINGVVYAVSVFNGNLIVGGSFTTAGGVSAVAAASWNGSQWSPMPGMDNSPWTFTAFNGQLVAGGTFTQVGNNGHYIAKWDGTTWSGFTKGMNRGVNAIVTFGSNIVVGGDFTSIGGIAAQHVAQWDGSNWSQLGSGTNGSVLALSVLNNELVVAGEFTLAGGASANRIAKWNGSTWSIFGSGMTSPTTSGTRVSALAIYNGQLVAGGTFERASGLIVRNIARWNGANWLPMNVGMVDESGAPNVSALTVFNGQLVAGGRFNLAGNMFANNVAKWDGNNWSALGGGIGGGTNAQVFALAVLNFELIVGGGFTTPSSRLSRWDGSIWRDVGGGTNDIVFALAVYDGALIAGGQFTVAGGTPKAGIARWMGGNSWTAMGSGTVGRVDALATFNSDLIAGGEFSSAGGIASPKISAFGLADATITEVVGVSPSPSGTGQTAVITARVTSNVAPTQGHITVLGSPGGSCSDLSVTPIGSTVAEATCSINWATPGIRSLQATYVGGTDGVATWQPSISVPFSHTVVLGDSIFANGFE